MKNNVNDIYVFCKDSNHTREKIDNKDSIKFVLIIVI